MNEYAVERLLGVLQSLTNEVQLFREAYVAHNSPKIEVKDESQTEDADCDKCIWSVCNYNKAFAFEDEPQTERIER